MRGGEIFNTLKNLTDEENYELKLYRTEKERNYQKDFQGTVKTWVFDIVLEEHDNFLNWLKDDTKNLYLKGDWKEYHGKSVVNAIHLTSNKSYSDLTFNAYCDDNSKTDLTEEQEEKVNEFVNEFIDALED